LAGKKVTVAVVKLQWDLHQVLPVVQHSLVCSVRLSRIRHNSVHHSSKHSSIRYNDVQHSTAAGNELIQNQLGRFRAQASGMHSVWRKSTVLVKSAHSYIGHAGTVVSRKGNTWLAVVDAGGFWSACVAL